MQKCSETIQMRPWPWSGNLVTVAEIDGFSFHLLNQRGNHEGSRRSLKITPFHNFLFFLLNFHSPAFISSFFDVQLHPHEKAELDKPVRGLQEEIEGFTLPVVYSHQLPSAHSCGLTLLSRCCRRTREWLFYGL